MMWESVFHNLFHLKIYVNVFIRYIVYDIFDFAESQ